MCLKAVGTFLLKVKNLLEQQKVLGKILYFLKTPAKTQCCLHGEEACKPKEIFMIIKYEN